MLSLEVDNHEDERRTPRLPGGNSGFLDVSSNAYYARAVDWAFANGITTGVDYGAFGPDTACTRAQIVTFLYRAR